MKKLEESSRDDDLLRIRLPHRTTLLTPKFYPDRSRSAIGGLGIEQNARGGGMNGDRQILPVQHIRGQVRCLSGDTAVVLVDVSHWWCNRIYLIAGYID